MLRQNKIPQTLYIALLAGILSILSASTSYAETPSSMDVQRAIASMGPSGIVLKIDTATKSIVVNGSLYYYGNETKVQPVSDRTGSISDISVGSVIGFSYITDNKKNHFLTQVWILNPGSSKKQ